MSQKWNADAYVILSAWLVVDRSGEISKLGLIELDCVRASLNSWCSSSLLNVAGISTIQ